MIAVKAPPETQLEVPDFSQVCVGAAGSVPHSVGSSGTQPCMILGGFGVSPWGYLILSWSFEGCNAPAGSLMGWEWEWSGIWVTFWVSP